MNKYLITFSSGLPEWKHSKWRITADSRSEALHKANLMHDDTYGFDVTMITMSKVGATEVSEYEFRNLDIEDNQKRIQILERIWNNSKNKLENC